MRGVVWSEAQSGHRAESEGWRRRVRTGFFLFGVAAVPLGVGCSRESSRPEPSESTERANSAASAAIPQEVAVATATSPQRVSPAATHHLGIRKLPIPEQQAYLVELLRQVNSLTPAQVDELNALIGASAWLSFGVPEVSEPGMAHPQCVAQRRALKSLAAPECGSPYMVPVEPPAGSARPAPVCIDQFEFPNVPCEYPVVWVRASEAAALCGVLGKRLCDAHEWEGACAGALLNSESEYGWANLTSKSVQKDRRQRRLNMEHQHNLSREVRWAYGKAQDRDRCGAGAQKNPGCTDADRKTCGTNDFPSGAFPDCVSPGGVYDLHGNVAEHMSLPLYPEELKARGSTEMKGSWFGFAGQEVHPDDCRWRARGWHVTRVNDPGSHRNYHLGFRCCKDLVGGN